MAVNEKTVNFCEFAEANQKMAFAKNIHIPNCFKKNPIHENGDFRGWERKNEPAVHKKGCFRGRGSGYLLYLYDVIEMVTKKENQI